LVLLLLLLPRPPFTHHSACTLCNSLQAHDHCPLPSVQRSSPPALAPPEIAEQSLCLAFAPLQPTARRAPRASL
jgi:hypothetical protein